MNKKQETCLIVGCGTMQGCRVFICAIIKMFNCFNWFDHGYILVPSRDTKLLMLLGKFIKYQFDFYAQYDIFAVWCWCLRMLKIKVWQSVWSPMNQRNKIEYEHVTQSFALKNAMKKSC